MKNVFVLVAIFFNLYQVGINPTPPHSTLHEAIRVLKAVLTSTDVF